MGKFSNIVAALCGKKLIAKKEYNHGKTRVLLELRKDNEIWAVGQSREWNWVDGPEIQLTNLPKTVMEELISSSDYKSFNAKQAIDLAWHAAAKINDFFIGADIFLQDHLIARRAYNGGQATAFLEIRQGSEFWIYGKFYDPRGVRGPEIKIELNLSPEVKEELLLRDSWGTPFRSDAAKLAVKQAWLIAAHQHPFFAGLIA